MSAQTAAQPRPLTVADAALRVGVHPRTVRRWIAAGYLAGYRYGPKLVRVDEAELDAFVARRLPASTVRGAL